MRLPNFIADLLRHLPASVEEVTLLHNANPDVSEVRRTLRETFGNHLPIRLEDQEAFELLGEYIEIEPDQIHMVITKKLRWFPLTNIVHYVLEK